MAIPAIPFQEVTSQSWQSWYQQLQITELQSPNGTALQMALALAKDSAVDRIRLSMKARLPTLAPTDALAQIAAERSFVQGISETATAFATRLLNAWTVWPYGGTAYGLLLALLGLGYTDVVLMQPVKGNQYSLSGTTLVTASAGNSGVKPWSQFIVLFVSPLPSSWGGGATLPSSTSDEVNRIRQVIRNWKPGHAFCTQIVVITAGRVLGYPIRTLGTGNGVLGGNTTTVWTP